MICLISVMLTDGNDSCASTLPKCFSRPFHLRNSLFFLAFTRGDTLTGWRDQFPAKWCVSVESIVISCAISSLSVTWHKFLEALQSSIYFEMNLASNFETLCLKKNYKANNNSWNAAFCIRISFSSFKCKNDSCSATKQTRSSWNSHCNYNYEF